VPGEEEFELSVDMTGAQPVVTLHGYVDPHTAPAVRQTLLDLVEDGRRRITVDLADVRLFDSSGVGALAHAYRSGAVITVTNPAPIVMRELVMCGFDRIVKIKS
jgi:anti-anti-sigma factor